MVLIELTKDFGYVVLTGVASVILTTYLGFKVGGARRNAGVPYPHAYASKEECEKDEKKMIFNCYQRAHQNTLEVYPAFLFTLLAGGINHPVLSSIGGGIWLFGRLIYAWGYYSGNPKQRLRGAFGYIGVLLLLGTSISSGVSLLTA
ncbi:12192_t:CDS:2 [Funneliformis geosporum]|uniref:Glutathione S-transferase 3, mitochondrial n=1 Tax=Funneliformis geosporum TaxID=1117311 RepID=A0A9W4SMB6_9GLOM|nr:12192_t:CDS:2 [Funneliformis geosporum]CAI2175376.1 11286_t:CDS:2 [Funneliformis geosporum]